MSPVQFNVTYKKSYGRNHMILEPLDTDAIYEEILQQNFRVQMIKENHIDGLLNTHIQSNDCIPSFYYDISGLQSLRVILESSTLTYHLLCRILLGLHTTLQSMEKYMLTYDQLLIDLEYIYMSPDYSSVCFCYYPLYQRDFYSSVQHLFEQMLKLVDHTDEKSVFLAYSIHKESLNSDFNIKKLLSLLSTVPSQDAITPMPNHTSITSHENLLKEDMCYNFTPNINENTTNIIDNSTFKSDLSRFYFKILVLMGCSLIALAAVTSGFLMGVYDYKFFFILLFIILVVAGYNGFMIYRMDAPSKLSSLIASSKPTVHKSLITPPVTEPFNAKSAAPTTLDTSSTVLLSPSKGSNIYRLIYIGTGQGHDIELKSFPFVIGKNKTCDSSILDPTVSRIHAKIDRQQNSSESYDIVIEDLNSTNGTLINDTLLSPYEKMPLALGDHVTFGSSTYILR